METDRTIVEDDLGDRAQIGKGGMATVYDVPSFILPQEPGGKWVYKKYKHNHRPVSLYAMQQLVLHRAKQNPRVRGALDRAFNWPRAVVTDKGDGASGVILPYLPDDYFVTLYLSSGAVDRKPSEGQFLFMDEAYCRRVQISYATVDQRRALVRSLCYGLAVLEHIGVVYGDLSPLNFLWKLTPRPAIMLVDCDSVRITGGSTAFGKQPHSPDWEPPEAKRAAERRDSTGYTIQSLATDRYKLGLAILRILTPGPGCVTRLDPSPARPALTPSLYSLLQRSLSDDGARRPSARVWYDAMVG